ncbi:DUF6279 family lipoprotein [Corallincola platygyrae]
MVYNYLDWLIPWTLDDYISLDSEQDAFVDRSLAQVLSWHRKQQLPLYTKDLESLRQQLQQPIEPAQVLEIIDKARSHWQHLIEVMFPALVELGQSLSDEQAKELVAILREELDEVKQENDDKTLEERQQEWRENMEEGLSDWIGELTDEQKARIETWSQSRTSSFDLWIAYRYRWIDELELTLSHRKDAARFEKEAERILLRLDEIREGEYLAQIEKNRAVYAQVMSDISAMMTEKQHQHLDEKLKELIDDLSALHREE